MKVAVIGGGAAGFFAALSVKEHHPKAAVHILEKSPNLLSKVKISGGGRCNVTNGETNIRILSEAYPRGGKQLKKAFGLFNTKHTMEWFENRNVPLTIQDDGCVFPVAQDSQVIIDCFISTAKKLGIKIKTGMGVKSINDDNGQWNLTFIKSGIPSEKYNKVIIATGGSPKRKGLEWLEGMNHQIVEPVPSLFTFNMPKENVKSLMGIVVEKTITRIPGTKLQGDGPLLITHWGMSGPAILKLSAFGARILHDRNYQFEVQVNWVNIINTQIIQDDLKNIIQTHPKKNLANFRPYGLPDRLWEHLIEKAGLPKTKRYNELGKSGINKLVNILSNDIYKVSGKTTFKEEFVTCGGVSLSSINFKTMESRECPGIYFAGEVMDVDGITGGYNFQAAWTTAWIAGRIG